MTLSNYQATRMSECLSVHERAQLSTVTNVNSLVSQQYKHMQCV